MIKWYFFISLSGITRKKKWEKVLFFINTIQLYQLLGKMYHWNDLFLESMLSGKMWSSVCIWTAYYKLYKRSVQISTSRLPKRQWFLRLTIYGIVQRKQWWKKVRKALITGCWFYCLIIACPWIIETIAQFCIRFGLVRCGKSLEMYEYL